MGILTPILIHYDALHLFGEDDGELSKKIYNAVEACSRYPQDIGHKGYCNYVTVHPSCHASADRVFVVSGGTMTELSTFMPDFQNLCKSHPDLINKIIASAKRTIRECEKELKNSTEEK